MELFKGDRDHPIFLQILYGILQIKYICILEPALSMATG
jgi:hypothetical protein